MTFWRLVFRSLFFYRRANAGVLIGTALGTAIIVGALVVGDSVRHSLLQLTLMRLGRTEYALDSGDHFLRADLADELASFLEADMAPAVRLRGIAVRADGGERVNGVQVLGVDGRFWALWPGSVPFAEMEGDRVVVSSELATGLGLREGEEIILRVEKLKSIPRDAPLLSVKSTTTALRLTVHAIASEDQFGRFGLEANQLAPLNAFVPLSRLSEAIGLPGRANVILAAGRDGRVLGRSELNASLGLSWKAADAGLTFRKAGPLGSIELLSDRVFLNAAMEETALQVGEEARGILTYFVNELRCGERATPYSFVSAPGEPIVPPGTADDEIIVNSWLAKDLGVRRGDSIEMGYYVLGPMQRLVEKSSLFRVKFVVPIEGAAADRDLMPGFPGLADVENCSDWEPGVPIDLKRIRDKDEEYWEKYRGTPKAFVTLEAARSMWKNRFGALTSVRYPGRGQTVEGLSDELVRRFRPASLGIVFSPVKEMGIEASSRAVDFGRLFLGLSFFLIVAAVLLTGLLFVFGAESRAEETGILLAIGFSPAWVGRLMIIEGTAIALFGAGLGVGLGILYDHAVLWALRTVWRGAVGTTILRFHMKPLTVTAGALCGTVVALLAMWVTVRRQVRLPLPELRGGGRQTSVSTRLRRSMPPLVVAGLCVLVALIVVTGTNPGRGREAATAFLVAGTLMLVCGLSLSHAFFLRMRKRQDQTELSVARIGVRNASRRRWRSLATVGLLACGTFLIAAVSANRHDPVGDPGSRESGTGGFSLYCESSMPILHDLNTKEGRRAWGLDDLDMKEIEFVQLRVHDGEDASCLNLNRVQQPRILGVEAREFARRSSFTFARTVDEVHSRLLWLALKQPISKHTVPAVTDYSVITWGLGKSVGDTLSYVDDMGERLNLRMVGGLANSIFQGSVLISIDHFLERFPTSEGSRIILVDCPPEKTDAIAARLADAVSDIGLEITPTRRRLAEFNAVENTYLSIFLMLGGLGLVLGCAGMGVVVLRNTLERRNELALLRAVGFSRHRLQWMTLCENWIVLVLGLACGLLAAFVAVLPAVASPGGDVPYVYIGALIAAVAASGVLWTYLATLIATRGDLLPALRGE